MSIGRLGFLEFERSAHSIRSIHFNSTISTHSCHILSSVTPQIFWKSSQVLFSYSSLPTCFASLLTPASKRTGSGLGSRRPRDQSIFNSRWKSHERMSKSTMQLGAGILHEEGTGCGRAKGNMAKTTTGRGARTPEAWHARQEE